jgi:hypothetical protein
MYDHNSKWYFRIEVPERITEWIRKVQNDPHAGNVLTVKIPFRYRRVMCEVRGRPIQSLVKGDHIDVEVVYKGPWAIGTHSGFSWVLVSCSSEV